MASDRTIGSDLVSQSTGLLTVLRMVEVLAGGTHGNLRAVGCCARHGWESCAVDGCIRGANMCCMHQ